MRKDIIKIALEEAKEYITSLQTSKVFQQVIDKYVRLHNKNIFVDFTFNSLDARSLFNSLAKEYGCQVGIVAPKFSREKNVTIGRLQDKVQKQKKEIYKEEQNVSKSFSAHQKMLEEMGLEKKTGNEKKVDAQDIYRHFQNGNTIPFLETMLQYEKEKIEQKSENYEKLTSMLKQTKEHTRYVEHALLSLERMFFNMIIMRYFGSIERYAKEMFGSNDVHLQYKKNILWKEYEERRKKEYIHVFGDECYTAFETKIIRFLEDKYNDFVFRVHHNGEMYQIGNSFQYTNYKHKKEYDTNYWEKRWEMLVQSHPEFIATVRTFALLQQSSDSQKVSAQIVLQYMHQRYNQELLQEHDKIITGLAQEEKKKEERYHHSSVDEMVQNMKCIFPHMEGETMKEPWFVMGKQYFNHRLLYVQNDEYHIQLYKAKELNPM